MKKFVLAVSGGMDSMVLLDFMSRKYDCEMIAVAHFDHGTRQSSKDDYDFVKRVCAEKGIEFHGKHAKLGAGVSEEKARDARYKYLFSVAQNNTLYTAHHLDDLTESVVINLLRGTGWRGLAVMNNQKITRPLLSWSKKDILKYAAENNICYREDSTNNDDEYLRNRLRPLVRAFNQKNKLYEMQQTQIELARKIDETVNDIVDKLRLEKGFRRDVFANLADGVAIEILRGLLKQKDISCTRPQLLDFLRAIREYQPGKYFNLPNDRLVRINKNEFVL